MGGLGNQMFQYAVARRMAIVHNVPLKLDITELRKSPLRTYRINHFNINAEPATEKEIVRFRPVGARGIFQQIRSLPDFFKPYYKRRLFKEQFFQYDSNIQQCQNDVYFKGYWQSEKYFKDIEQVIRQDFTPVSNPDARNEKMADQIRDCESVSLHVRRGDYVSNPTTNATHGTCSEEYYLKAIRKLEDTIKDPHFFIFSDDPAWARDNLKTGHSHTVIDINGPNKDYEDLRLMSLCQYHIIANSSFSWWGAWLCSNPQKIVITPQKWFNKPDINTDDLIPESWIRL